MNKSILTYIGILILFFTIACTPQEEPGAIKIIPNPQKVTPGKGVFHLNNKTLILAGKGSEKTAAFLNTILEEDFQLQLSSKNLDEVKKSKNAISFKLDHTLEKTLGGEGYQLNIKGSGIEIMAVSNTGLFYGVQSLRQLLPVQLEKESKEKISLALPFAEITDYPRFGWRAYMLDDGRYFNGMPFVKKMLDQMALLKMNVFHWHLVDDGGWRIEIKKYPKLTEIGSHRKDSEIETWKSGKLAGEPHGGFYTQEEIKEVVAYAAERHITVVPEFEMPGHASASIASYPWIGTDKKEIEVPVTFGRKRDIYDVTDPKVIDFIHDVFEEIFELFPSEVIHIGGDEVNFDAWREAAHVQKYMKEKGLKTPADLQIHFTNNISKYIESKGRRMMGWNEIMGINIHSDHEEKQGDKDAESSLAKNVIIHFWKGDIKLLTEAAENGYELVNSLHSETYLDYSLKSIPVKRAYSFDPIPKDLPQQYHKQVKGLGCQMWTEWTPTTKVVENQTFPRIAAYAEVGWTSPEEKDFLRFIESLEILKMHWKKAGIVDESGMME